MGIGTTLTDIVMGRVKGKTENVVCVGGVELLCVGLVVVDNAQCSNVVDDVSLLCVVEVAATVIATITGG